jgi:hypothetical protein
MKLLQMCEMTGVKRNWIDKELALKYLYNLRPANSGLLLNLNAQQNMGNDYFPKTVRLAQSTAARHLVPADVTKANIFDAELNEVDEYVLVTLRSGEAKTIKIPEGLKETPTAEGPIRSMTAWCTSLSKSSWSFRRTADFNWSL